MEKTININLGGSLFRIDEEAFYILRDYLYSISNQLKNTPGGPEAIEDIESRIAEIFQSQKGIAGVITRDNIEAMISIIGRPEDFDTSGSDEIFPPAKEERKKLYRNPDDSIISGVCGGLGAYFNTDPVLFRILFVIFTLFFFSGVILYVGLWIAVPSANTPVRKKEMYGSRYHDLKNLSGKGYRPDYASSAISNGLNEFFRAIGRVFFIIFRIFMIIFGAVFVLTGFLFILSFVMVFIFKIPGSFTADGIDFNISYFPGIINYIVQPSNVPWIYVLASLIIILPLIALIYWGVRMIFWFRVHDGLVNLAGLVLWIMCIAALSIICFSEGVSFAESQRTVSQSIMKQNPDTLYVIAGNRIENIAYEKQYVLPDEDMNNVFVVDTADNIYIKPHLRIRVAEKDGAMVEIMKRSSGRNRAEAMKKSESLVYNQRMSNDTLYLDEYFKIPAGNKWTADFVTVNLVLPEKTVIFIDRTTSALFHRYIEIETTENEETQSSIDFDTRSWELGGKYWILTTEGLSQAGNEEENK